MKTTSTFEISREDLIKERFKAIKITSSHANIDKDVITSFVELLKTVL